MHSSAPVILLNANFTQDHSHSIDWNGSLPHTADSSNVVIVTSPNSYLSQEEHVELTKTINPLEDSPDYEIQLYFECLDFVLKKYDSVLFVILILI